MYDRGSRFSDENPLTHVIQEGTRTSDERIAENAEQPIRRQFAILK